MVWQARHFSSRLHTTHTHDDDESDVDEGSEYRHVIMLGCGASVSVTISPYHLLESGPAHVPVTKPSHHLHTVYTHSTQYTVHSSVATPHPASLVREDGYIYTHQ